MILDTAGAKGTGKWMSQLALDLGVPSTLVTEAVYARCLSAMKDARVRGEQGAARARRPSSRGDRKEFIEQIRQALYASKICSYAQGYRADAGAAAEEYKLAAEVRRASPCCGAAAASSARCSSERIKEAFDADPKLENLLLAPYFTKAVARPRPPGGNVVTTAVELGIPVPAFAAALAYYDGYRSERLPANLLQAQRDYFGAHTYERIDKPAASSSTPTGPAAAGRRRPRPTTSRGGILCNP